MCTLNLSDITSKFRSVAISVIIDLEAVLHTQFSMLYNLSIESVVK
jgi:hypothetical protein